MQTESTSRSECNIGCHCGCMCPSCKARKLMFPVDEELPPTSAEVKNAMAESLGGERFKKGV